MRNEMKTATPTKLRSGEWGARVEGQISVGDTIEIRTRAGKLWSAIVVKVIWHNNEVALVATRSCEDKYGRPNNFRNSQIYGTKREHDEGYCGYPCRVTGQKCCPENGPCHDCI